MRRSRSLFSLGLAAIAALAGVALAHDQAETPTPVGVITIESVPAQRVLSRQIQGGYDKHQEVFNDLKGTMAQLSRGMKVEASTTTSTSTTTTTVPTSSTTTTTTTPTSTTTSTTTTTTLPPSSPADCIALYGVDPDSTTTPAAKAAFSWTAALLVPDNFKLPAGTLARALSVPASDYRLETLPAVEAAVMYSTIGRAPTDGLKFFAWMADNGYVQVGATRMLYFTDPRFDLLRATAAQVRDSKTKIFVPIKKRERPIALKKEQAQE